MGGKVRHAMVLACVVTWILVFGGSGAQEEENTKHETPKSLEAAADKIHHADYKLYNVTPFCVQEGHGWVWHNGQLPDISIFTEGKRLITPVDLRGTSPLEATWDNHSIPYLGTLEPLSFLHTYPLYHFLWSYISTTMALTHVETLYNTTRVIPFYKSCPTSRDWQETAWLGSAWQEAARRHAGSCISDTLHRTKLLRATGSPYPLESYRPGLHCFPWGLVGAMRMKELASRYQVVYGKWFGAVKCRGKKCKFPGVGRAWASFAATMSQRLRTLGVGDSAVQQARTMVVIDRVASRKILDSKQLVAVGNSMGWEVQLARFEEMTTLDQLKMILSAGAVLGVHGSGLAWSLLGRAGTVWVEIVPHAKGCRKTSANMNSSFITVDTVGIPNKLPSSKLQITPTGLEGYGVLVRYTGGHHISWTASCPNCTQCPTPSNASYPFKDCDVTIPQIVVKYVLHYTAILQETPKKCQSGTNALTQGAMVKRKMVIDTDCSSEDSIALLCALNCTEVEVVAICCVWGNVQVEAAARNVTRILEFTGNTHIPVYVGADGPLIDKRDQQRRGTNDRNTDHASVALSRILGCRTRDESTWQLVALGPLTNVALAIRMCPNILQGLGSEEYPGLVVMGGTLRAKGNSGLSSEFNWHCDPEAAMVVLESTGNDYPFPTPTATLVPWEVVTECPLTWQQCDQLLGMTDSIPQEVQPYVSSAEYRNRMQGLLRELLQGLQSIERDGNTSCLIPDAVAMVLAIDPLLSTYSINTFATVELASSESRGSCVIDWYGTTQSRSKKKRWLNVTVTASTDAATFVKHIFSLVGHPSPSFLN